MALPGTAFGSTSGSASAPYPAPPASGGRFGETLQRMNAADRMIGWGIVLLLLAAVAAGAISFNFGAEAGTR